MRKVLIITYYWPPAGGPGVQRIVKFVKYLPEFGWQPIILTTRGHDAPAQDLSLAEKIPPEAVIYTSRTLEPFGAYKRLTGRKQGETLSTNILTEKAGNGRIDNMLRWVRANFFIPDARMGSIPFLYRKGMEIISTEKPELIFSTSPPHSVQLAARRIARKSGLPWVADLRDPWSGAYWLKDLPRTTLAKRLDAKLENKVLTQADVLTTVSQGLSDMFQAGTGRSATLLYNGFEIATTTRVEHDKFIILFIGDLSRIQDPTSLFRALDGFSDETLKNIELHFVGRIYRECYDLIKSFHRITVRVLEYMPIRDLMLYARKASVLFKPYTATTYSAAIIQAKTFDYLAMRKPILAFDEEGSVISSVLSDTRSGKAIPEDKVPEIFDFISGLHEEWLEKKCLLLNDHTGLDAYRTRTNVGKLATVFDQVTGKEMGIPRE